MGKGAPPTPKTGMGNKTCNANHLKFSSFLSTFFFHIKRKEKTRKYLGFAPCQITSEEDRPDQMKCSSLEKSSSVGFPALFTLLF